MADKQGPGHTGFIANEDGSISVRRWNDPAWTTHFASSHELTPEHISRLLARAYQMGMEDRATIIKQAIGI